MSVPLELAITSSSARAMHVVSINTIHLNLIPIYIISTICPKFVGTVFFLQIKEDLFTAYRNTCSSHMLSFTTIKLVLINE
jgi:hypothetical protein